MFVPLFHRVYHFAESVLPSTPFQLRDRMMNRAIPSRSRHGTCPSRLDGIDLLRRLAVVFMLMNHVNMACSSRTFLTLRACQSDTFQLWFGTASAACRYFSPSPVSDHFRHAASLEIAPRYRPSRYLFMRFARIAPLLVLLFIVFSTLHLANVHNFVVKPETGGLPRAFLAALTFTSTSSKLIAAMSRQLGHPLVPQRRRNVCLFFPLAARLLGRRKLFVIPLFGVRRRRPFRAHHPLPRRRSLAGVSYLGGIDAIALGCLAALLLARQTFPALPAHFADARHTPSHLHFMLLAPTPRRSPQRHRSGHDPHRSRHLLHHHFRRTVPLAGTAYPVSTHQSRQRSYEVYLTHMFMVFAMFDNFLHIGQPMSAVVLLFLIVTGLSALLGGIVARLYSEPLNSFIRARFLTAPTCETVSTRNSPCLQ